MENSKENDKIILVLVRNYTKKTKKGWNKRLKITDVRVRLVEKDGSKLRAVASMTIDECFVVHDIKIIEGKEGYFISMPSRKTPDGEYRDIVHPINTETREQVVAEVLKVFEKAEKEAE